VRLGLFDGAVRVLSWMHNAAHEWPRRLNSHISAPPLVCFQPLKIGARLALGRARSRLAVCAGKTGPGRLPAGVPNLRNIEAEFYFPKNLDVQSRTDAMVAPIHWPGVELGENMGVGLFLFGTLPGSRRTPQAPTRLFAPL
jgi:hypothetical protein